MEMKICSTSKEIEIHACPKPAFSFSLLDIHVTGYPAVTARL
jgi:hypothetical protein